VLPDWSSIVFVPAGNIEGDPGHPPSFHMFAASRADWYPITGGLPQHAAFRRDSARGQTVERRRPRPRPVVVAGNCLCNAIAWELTGLPERMHNCHCSRCRRARSAAHATNAFFKREQLTWLRGSRT
jgi:hypothetical protein